MFSYLHLPVFLWGLQCLTYYRSWKLLPLYTMLLLDSYVLSIFYKTNSHLLLCYLCEFPRLHPLIICCYLSYLFLWEENKLFSRVDYCLIDNSWAAHRKPQMCIFYMWTLVQTLIHLEAWKIALKGKCGHTTWGEKKKNLEIDVRTGLSFVFLLLSWKPATNLTVQPTVVPGQEPEHSKTG